MCSLGMCHCCLDIVVMYQGRIGCVTRGLKISTSFTRFSQMVILLVMQETCDIGGVNGRETNCGIGKETLSAYIRICVLPHVLGVFWPS